MSNNGSFGFVNPANSSTEKAIAIYRNLDKDFVLSPADMGSTVRIEAPNTYRVRLPDARQLVADLMVIITNASTTTAFDIIDNNGGIIKTVLPLQTAIVWNTSKTTSSGVWTATIMGKGSMTNISLGAEQNIYSTSVAANRIKVCGISDTRAVLFYVTGSTMMAVLLTIAGSAITAGTPITVQASANVANDVELLLSSSTGNSYVLFAYQYPTGAAIRYSELKITSAGVLSVSVSANSGLYADTTKVGIAAIDDTHVMVVGYVGNVAYTRLLTIVHDTSITESAAYLFTTSNAGTYNCMDVSVDNSQVIYVYCATGGNTYACVGNTTTRATSELLLTAGLASDGGALAKITTGKALFIAQNGTASILTVTGTGASATIAETSVTSLGISQSTSLYESGLSSIDGNTFVFTYLNASGYPCQTLILVNGSTITVKSTTVMVSSSAGYAHGSVLPGVNRTAIGIYRRTSDSTIYGDIATNY